MDISSLWMVLAMRWMALVLALALAGCSGPAEDEGTPDMAGVQDKTASLAMPAWAVGDYWTFSNPFGDPTTLVVSGETASDWTMDTDSVDLAFFHALQPVSYMGTVAKSDLAGSQASGPVKFFDWPLEDGKTWSARWDDRFFTMVATQTGDETFLIEAKDGDTAINRFQYSNATGWFDWVSWGDDTGAEQFRVDLLDAGHGFSGEVVRVTPEEVDQQDYSGLAQNAALYNDIAGDDVDAYIQFAAQCTQGVYSFALGTAEALTNTAAELGVFEDQGFSTMNVQCPASITAAGVVGHHPANGDHWGHVMASQSPDLELTFTLWLRHIERITL